MASGGIDLATEIVCLEAMFAQKMTNPDISSKSASDDIVTHRAALLLETPTTNLELLKSFFDQAQSFSLPTDFSQTPLGLLVSEDDSPERRVRSGFEDSDKILVVI